MSRMQRYVKIRFSQVKDLNSVIYYTWISLGKMCHYLVCTLCVSFINGVIFKRVQVYYSIQQTI